MNLPMLTLCISVPSTFYASLLTVRLLEPGHLGEDYRITTFFGNKRFSSFFCKRTNKI